MICESRSDYATLRGIVAANTSDTLMAQAMRRAFGIAEAPARKRAQRHDGGSERRRRYYERLMKNRHCNLG